MNIEYTGNPKIPEEIEVLEGAIRAFKNGSLPEERFRSIRTTRGVYSQRQPGGQMVRIKLPLGRVSFNQLLCLADITDHYSKGIIHLTTRQDVQIYDVSLDKTVELWARLEQENITLKGAGGNTVRNVTASPSAGIDPLEPFDVTPYAWTVFQYFLHNPVCEEMGRKIKIAFSAGPHDTAFSFIHDLGFIPVIVSGDQGNVARGFRVMLGGGLGAQPFLAKKVNEFLPEDQLIPFIEAVLRVFNRYGERNNRNRARLKFLVQSLGIDRLLSLIEEEKTALAFRSFMVDKDIISPPSLPGYGNHTTEIARPEDFALWVTTNVFEQKQPGYYGVYVRIPSGGDITTERLRALVGILREFAADDVRITQNQDLLLRFVKKSSLPDLFNRLYHLGVALPGAESIADITSCRGTESCNLAISNTLALSAVLEEIVFNEYRTLITGSDIRIKVSGCMNSCGQHAIAGIGFHGSSIRAGSGVLPAAQVLLGGGVAGDGSGRIAEKIIKVPARRVPEALRLLLGHYQENVLEGERFVGYYDRFGKDFFYRLLKPVADLASLTPEDFIDWGQKIPFKTAIGTGECAGASSDLISLLLEDADEKLIKAKMALDTAYYADSIHHTYTSLITIAKAILLKNGIRASSQHGIISDFDKHFTINDDFFRYPDFYEFIMQINRREPSAEFAGTYLEDAIDFVQNFDLITGAT